MVKVNGKSLKKPKTIEVFDKNGQVIETYTEVSDNQFFEKLHEVYTTTKEQAHELEEIKIQIYASEMCDLLEFDESDLIAGNENYKDMNSSLILTKRVTQAFMKAEEPIEIFGEYLEKSQNYFQNVHNYVDCMNAVVEEGMLYFVSDKNNMRAIAFEQLPMAQEIMNLEANRDEIKESFKETNETKHLYV